MNLLWPAGQEVTCNRLGSMGGTNDFILDVYQVQITGYSNPVKLYVDMYSDQDLMIPSGFTCYTTIPITDPEE
jgi:hypothetical protein